MIRHTRYWKGMALSIAIALLTSGCGTSAGTSVTTGSVPAGQDATAAEEKRKPDADNTGTGGSENDLVAVLKAKYDAGVIDYSGDTIRIDREEAIQIKLGYNPWDEAAMDLTDSFMVYQDAELKHPLDLSGYDWNPDSGMMTIEPPVYGPAEVVLMDTGHSSSPFLENNDETGWGSLSQLYLATYVDKETGSPLSGRPLVTVLKINTELEQAPQVKFSQDESGSARFSWKEVPGAEEYLLFSIKNYDGALDGYMNVLAVTTDTEWTAEQSMSMDDTYAVTMNDMFRQYLVSEDYRGELEEDDFMEDDYVECYGIMAVSSTGSSHISNLFNGNELAHMLPYAIAYNSNDEAIGNSCAGTTNLPAAVGIVMCDGTISQRVIEYNKEDIEKTDGDQHYNIQYKVCGTPFSGTFLVTDQDWSTFDQELEAIVQRQEKLKNKGGNVEADISFINEGELPEQDGNTEETSVTQDRDTEGISATQGGDTEGTDTQDEAGQTGNPEAWNGKITANSALSEYLAIQMLGSSQAIDISAFPESADTSLVVDAFLEAQYQNPLILGIKEVGMDTDNSILYIRYDDDAQTMEAKRRELEEKITQITDEIITDGMSDLEKELAINQYLCDHAEYDNGALENAAENDFTYVDEKFNDSFTAYGVLINHVGVCASYSAAFKLLADAAELDSIVVTGYLDGNLPHAWNKVMLDGQWNIVDATNNDNEVIQNALFNLSDSAAYATLVEDDRFVLDTSLYDYEALSDDKEYYRITDNYFAMEEITGMLAEKLQSTGNAALRTDYDLDDETFNQVAQEAANLAQADISGFHWMGVIHLELK